MTTSIENLINENVELLLYENALFYAERLHAAEGTPESLYTLANVHLKSGDSNTAINLMKNHYPFIEHFSPVNKHHAMGKLLYLYGVTLARAEKFLAAERVLMDLQKRGHLKTMSPIQISAVKYWIGVICTNTKRETMSLECYGRSIQEFPYNWSAIERYLTLRPDTNFDTLLTPKSNTSTNHDQSLNASPSLHCDANLTTPGRQTCTTSGIGSQIIHSTPSAKSVESSLVGNFLPVQLQQLLLDMTKILSACYSYNMPTAVQKINNLPLEQKESGYVLGLLAKSYYDDGLYAEAAQVFRRLRSAEPYRLDRKLAFYSSCLWQLRDEKKLAHLAQELIHLDKLSDITQIVLGNTHSVVGEHDTAIQFLSRAFKIDKLQPYASTLKGFEHLVLDELEDASQCFRMSLHLDSKHYAAWHGLGTVFMKQERWKEAVVHFERATRINPNPPIMLAYANALMEEVNPGCVDKAFTVVNRVLEKHPDHALARLRQGEILLKRGRLNAAKEVAISLLGTAPREPKVNLLLARVYKKLGDRSKALQYFTFALGLKPRDSAVIKLELDRYQEGAGEDESDY